MLTAEDFIHARLRQLQDAWYMPAQGAIQKVQEAHADGVDYLINNAGVLGSYSRAQDQ